MEDLTPYLAFAALVYTATNFLDDLAVLFLGDSLPGYAKQVTAWIAGVVVTLLAASTNFAAGIPTFSGASLATASITDIVFVGLTVAGIAGFGASVRNAIKSPSTNTK